MSIAIGAALNNFRNTHSNSVISRFDRSIDDGKTLIFQRITSFGGFGPGSRSNKTFISDGIVRVDHDAIIEWLEITGFECNFYHIYGQVQAWKFKHAEEATMFLLAHGLTNVARS